MTPTAHAAETDARLNDAIAATREARSAQLTEARARVTEARTKVSILKRDFEATRYDSYVFVNRAALIATGISCALVIRAIATSFSSRGFRSPQLIGAAVGGLSGYAAFELSRATGTRVRLTRRQALQLRVQIAQAELELYELSQSLEAVQN